MKRCHSLLSLMLLAGVCPVGMAAEPVKVPLPEFEPAFQAKDVRPHVEFLAGPELRGRAGDDARKAAEYIVAIFQKTGLKPLFADNSFFQPLHGAKRDDGTTPLIGRNIGAWLPGTDPALKDEYVIVSAHYDHLGVRNGEIFAGADDNASGTAMLLEVARSLAASKEPPRRSVVFLAFDLEEHMLWGSRWFVDHPPWPLERVKFFLTADMIGRSLGSLQFPVVYVMGSEHAPQVKQSLDRVGIPRGLEVSRLGIDLIGTRSDYGPFRDREVPFLFFSTGQNPDYHSPQDTPDRIDYDKLALVSSLILRLTTDIANQPAAPVWTPAAGNDLDEPRTLLRICTLLLEAEKQRPLNDLQRYMVTDVERRCRKILDKGTMTPGDRAWLIRMSQLLLATVF